MAAQFIDLQYADNPLNAMELANANQLFRSLRGRSPFLFELHSDRGSMLTVGYAAEYGSVQFSASDGSPPYLMALSSESYNDNLHEFLAGGTPTPIPGRFCLPIASVEQIVAEFLEHGVQSHLVSWEEI
jgi:hypothetical protein